MVARLGALAAWQRKQNHERPLHTYLILNLRGGLYKPMRLVEFRLSTPSAGLAGVSGGSANVFVQIRYAQE
jgi:hypothetical protein